MRISAAFCRIARRGFDLSKISAWLLCGLRAQLLEDLHTPYPLQTGKGLFASVRLRPVSASTSHKREGLPGVAFLFIGLAGACSSIIAKPQPVSSGAAVRIQSLIKTYSLFQNADTLRLFKSKKP